MNLRYHKKELLLACRTAVLSFIVFQFILPSASLAAFSKTNFVSNNNFANNQVLSESEINAFFTSHNSWLGNGYYPNNLIPEYITVQYPSGLNEYSTVQARQFNDTNNTALYGKTIAQLILSESSEHNVNPRLLLSLFQRESSSISSSAPSSLLRESWPLFYMYDDTMKGCAVYGTNCNDSYYGEPNYQLRASSFGGIGLQIAFATAWLRKNYNCFENPTTCTYTGSTLTWFRNPSNAWNASLTIDNETFQCENIATRVFYRYTPGILPGQKNLYDNYSEWFGDPTSLTVVPPSPETTTEPAVTPPPPPPRKMGDGNGDNTVDSTDLSILADQWGKSVTPDSGADFNKDGVIDSTDLSILADAWGK